MFICYCHSGYKPPSASNFDATIYEVLSRYLLSLMYGGSPHFISLESIQCKQKIGSDQELIPTNLICYPPKHKGKKRIHTHTNHLTYTKDTHGKPNELLFNTCGHSGTLIEKSFK